MNDKFEKAFGDFIERREYDDVGSAVFALTRSAFIAGWRAAGGAMPEPQPIFKIIERDAVDP